MPTPVRPVPKTTKAPTIAIVDDELDILLALSDSLHGAIPGARIFPSESAAEALEFMQDHHVDLVITDWRMPGLSGTELGDILNRSKRPPPIILMTGHPSAGLTYRAVHDHKFAAIFSKPFEPDEMAAKVLGLLADSMGYDPSAQAAPEPRQAAGGRRLGRA